MRYSKDLIILLLIVALSVSTFVLLKQMERINNINYHNNLLGKYIDDLLEEKERRKISIDFGKEEKFLLAQIVEAEARNQGFEGKKAVAEVILNRVESEKFPNTIKEVITQPRQFQPYTSRSYKRVNPTEETYRAIVDAYNKRDLPSNVLYFCNYDIIGKDNKSWFDTLGFYDKIGDHTFYINE